MFFHLWVRSKANPFILKIWTVIDSILKFMFLGFLFEIIFLQFLLTMSLCFSKILIVYYSIMLFQLLEPLVDFLTPLFQFLIRLHFFGRNPTFIRILRASFDDHLPNFQVIIFNMKFFHLKSLSLIKEFYFYFLNLLILSLKFIDFHLNF